tara:strand:- start:98494 stop:98913 length:420 start_codon:yes stop_codon:yes gene_type:complete
MYRAMRKDSDDKPIVDSSGKGLGVRGVPVNGVTDVDLDSEGCVLLNNKGMSVAPRWRDLPIFLISKRLIDKVPGARGSSNLYCFTMGGGNFQDGDVSESLTLRVDSKSHGVICPMSLMRLADYEIELASTREQWGVDED